MKMDMDIDINKDTDLNRDMDTGADMDMAIDMHPVFVQETLLRFRSQISDNFKSLIRSPT
jgi:hypothetical protein